MVSSCLSVSWTLKTQEYVCAPPACRALWCAHVVQIAQRGCRAAAGAGSGYLANPIKSGVSIQCVQLQFRGGYL